MGLGEGIGGRARPERKSRRGDAGTEGTPVRQWRGIHATLAKQVGQVQVSCIQEDMEERDQLFLQKRRWPGPASDEHLPGS